MGWGAVQLKEDGALSCSGWGTAELPKGEGTRNFLVGAVQPNEEGASHWLGGSECYKDPGLI